MTKPTVWQADLASKMASSSLVLTIAPDDPLDPKVALETGYAVLLDKPIVLVIAPGRTASDNMRRLARKVIEADLTTDAGRQLVMAELAAYR